MAEFFIRGDNFSPSMITKKLAITPTRTYNKGDILKYNKKGAIETVWEISTGYEESFDINNQLTKIINLIKEKKDILKKIKNRFHVDFGFNVVIEIRNGETPAVHWNKDIIGFANEIGAEFDCDLYIIDGEV